MPISSEHRAALEAKLNGVIASLGPIFSPPELREVEEFAENREYGVCVETIVDIAAEEKRALPQSLIDELHDLSEMMEVPVPEGLDNVVVVPAPRGP